MIFDYDTDKTAFHPKETNEALFEWKRKNIENYLLVPDAWKRAIHQVLGIPDDLFLISLKQIVDDFFASENLTIPPNKKWGDLDANVFKVVDGKKILFDSKKSLFNQLRKSNPELSLTREAVAGAMIKEEIHQDVKDLFKKIEMINR